MDPYAAQAYPQNQPPNQDPYYYNQHYNQPQDYQYYPQIPPQQYPNPIPNPEHAPIHPPGVPIQTDPNQIASYQHGYDQSHFQHDPSSYYPQQPPQQLSYPDPGVGVGQPQQWQQQGQTADYGLTSVYPPNGQGQHSGSGRGGGGGGGGRGFRGGGSSFRGRGRGRGRGGGKATVSQPKPQCMAWCELCRVDCNTLEILENHRNGKKHKKNLKIQEDLQRLAAKTQETQAAAAAAAAAVAEKPETPSLMSQVKVFEGQGNGLKRKMRDEERKSADPSKKPKEIIPFICELCNVKCESAPTFDSHLKGKKHMFNLQQFQEQQATLSQAALQALYPAIEALYPVLLQAITLNANASTSAATGGLDPQVLQWLQAYLPQAGPLGPPQGPESAPGFVTQGPNVGAAQEAPGGVAENQVAAVNEVKAEPESKREEHVDGESKAELVDSNAAELTK